MASDCLGNSYLGRSPEILNDKMKQRFRVLCYSEYEIGYSGLSRGPLWTSERLTRERIAKARSLEHVTAYHEDGQVPEGDRSALEDYVRSGYDRGHMAPSGDMSNPTAQAESFTLANMVPQSPGHNRTLWLSIESKVRDLAVKDGELYVVTGPIYVGGSVSALRGRVLVPTHLFKAVYSPGTGQAGAYLSPNNDSDVYQVISIEELRKISGVEPFPGVPESIKQATPALPSPSGRSGKAIGSRSDATMSVSGAWEWLGRQARGLWR
jgi:endonuclease G